MKKFVLLLLLPLVAFTSVREKVYFRNSVFQGYYSEKLEQPLEVQYYVMCSNGTSKRIGMDFFTNDSIHTSDNDDYANNVYDKGHCAPAADFNCTREMLLSTFSYLNCVLQHQDLNRGTWRLLEEHERKLSNLANVKVSILMVYTTSSVKLPTGATIPNEFYKYITVNGKTTIYYFKNEKPLTNDYTKYIVSKGPKLSLK